MTTDIFVAVYRNESDSYKFRHAALYFEYPDGFTTLMNIEGMLPDRKFRERPRNDPRKSNRFFALCPVASLQVPVNRDSIKAVVSGNPVSQDPEFNCHHWVGDAAELQNHGYITKSHEKRVSTR